MSFRVLAASLLLGVAAAAVHADTLPEAQPAMLNATADKLPPVDRVVVHKAERRMMLMRGGNIVRSYHVHLGLNPVGQKERSGDFRTPEGTYRLERRNPRSEYFLSIQVS